MNSTLLMITISLTILIAAILLVLFRARHRTYSFAMRAIIAVVAVIVLLASPSLFDMAVILTNRTEGLERAMVDPSWVVKSIPGVMGLLLAGAVISALNREVSVYRVSE